MDDKELLESAARAAGMTREESVGRMEDFGGWNPLENDGDAFRLMVTCRLFLQVSDDDGGCTRIIDEFGDTILREMHFNDDNENAATRRAIVRAAVAMGENQ